MKDVEYVKAILETEYPTEYEHEHPYPDISDVIVSTEFDYLAGTVVGEVPNGAQSRDGFDYLWFKHGNKSILTHRFIAALTIGKWPPRECNVDHVNHDPSDNQPANLRIVTPRDNAGNRRAALLSELVDLKENSNAILLKKRASKAEAKPDLPWKVMPQRPKEPEPTIELRQLDLPPPPKQDPHREFMSASPFFDATYTGETMPGACSGTYFKTNAGSWHWYPDGRQPDELSD